MRPQNAWTGTGFALACLVLLGVMPIISNSRPAASSALTFAVFLSLWQLLFSLPLLLAGLTAKTPRHRGIFAAHLGWDVKRRTIAVILGTGMIFGLSTFTYVFAVEKAGAVSAAIAMQSYPLFAILLETLFLKRRKSALELLFTLTLMISLTYLATGGTWSVKGLSGWLLLALSIPFMWSVAHIIVREVMGRTPITPAQITFFRVLISALFLGAVLLIAEGPGAFAAALQDRHFQSAALVMGLVYYLELIFWFYAIRSIDVSLASSITIPWPALTMVLAVIFLGEPVATYQIVTFVLVAASIYGLMFAAARKATPAP